jgi:colanic acid biosynthesis glycosyl transferase WcaI
MMQDSPALRAVGAWCRYVYRHVDRVLTLSPGMCDRLIQRGSPADRTDYMYNWALSVQESVPGARAATREELRLDGSFVVLFAGNIGPLQGLPSVVEAAQLLSESCPRVTILLVGDGGDKARIEGLIQDRRVANIRLLPRCTGDRLAALYAAADALLVHLDSNAAMAGTIPSKTQTYLSMGKPIVSAATRDTADLVSAAGAGICCEPGNPAALAAAIVLLASNFGLALELGARGKQYFDVHLSLDSALGQLNDLLEQTVRGAERS